MNPTEEAIKYLTNFCSRIGAFRGTTDVNKFLKRVASDISISKESAVFPSRYREHVAYAVDMVASNFFTSPPAAIASVYLNTRFEFYFRILSRKLNEDGTWITPQEKILSKATLGDNRLDRNRVDSVALAYKILKIDKSISISKHCDKLDNILYSIPITMPDGYVIADIGNRIEYTRHRVAHGQWGDISSEAIFYGLMTAIVFYNQY